MAHVQSRIQRFTIAAGAAWFSALMSPLAIGQLAPVMGGHYAAQPSNSGVAFVNSGGGYNASVPLDFSQIDQTLPLPIQVAYGGKRMGAAGLGWDMPLSYFYHDTTAAHRRPESATKGHERWVLSLLGEQIELVPKNGSASAAPTIWVAARGRPQLEVRVGGGGILAYDGEGRAYGFESRDLTPGTSGQLLVGGNLFVLTGISGPGGKAIVINYAYSHPTLPSGGTGLSIDLTDVFYDNAGAGFTFKHRAVVRYTANAAPLSITMFGTTPIVRTKMLSFIAVEGNRPGGNNEELIRQYNFAYQADVDTGLPRLNAVTMTGQQGTPEAAVTLPIASYGYGSIVDPATNKITFEQTTSVHVPTGASLGLAWTGGARSTEPHSPDDVVTDLTTAQTLLDFNGDGRVDVVTIHPTLTSFNRPFDGGAPNPNPFESDGTAMLPQSMRGGGGLVLPENLIHSTVPNGATRHDRATQTSINDTLRMLIDMNGDGRLDVVETSAADTDHWIIHLNTPDPSNPKNGIWVDISVPVTAMRAALNTTGLTFGRVPLTRTTSVRNVFAHCWFWSDVFGGRWQEDGIAGCSDIPANYSLSKTITEFELRDVNGDGYPDFVFNASFVNTTDPVAKPPIPPNPVNLQHASTLVAADMVGLHDVKVLFNTAGARLANGVTLFGAAPVTLEVGGSTGCGVARWEPDPGITSADTRVRINQTCGLEDVNGDGIADRLTSTIQSGQVSTRAALGTGDVSNPFSAAATIVLPGPVGRTESDAVDVLFAGGSDWETACQRSATTVSYDIQRTRGLRDINGDGIPDYVTGTRSASGTVSWSVAMGTGTGFTAPIAVDSAVGLELSLERAFCSSTLTPVSVTPAGLYNLDGEAQPELMTSSAESPSWGVYQLKRHERQIAEVGQTFSIPEAGLLTRIDNGYGAITRIGYRSAKQVSAGFSGQQVPGPQIVVAAVATTDPSGGTPLATTHRYAYGNIGLYFDASADTFVSTGYQRFVHLSGTVDGTPNAGMARIADSYGPHSFTSATDDAFSNNLITGHPSDVTTLSGSNLGTDPWTLLTVNTSTDTRRIAGVHHNWATRLLPVATQPANNTICANADPYNFTAPGSLTSADDMCVKNGFVFETSNVAWRGAPGSDPQPALSRSVVATDTEVKPSDVDNYGRVTVVGEYNDLNRGDDDECILTTFANPPTPDVRPRVLNRPALRTVTNCATTPVMLSKYTWEYDTAGSVKLPAGQVTNGFVTAHIVTRLDEQGNPIADAAGHADIRQFDAVVDAHGNVTSTSTTRDDGATQTVATAYDPFNLVPVTVRTSAVNADGTSPPTQQLTITRDSLTLKAVNIGEPNGTRFGNSFDGFGRVLLSMVTPVGGSTGALSAVAYNGFAAGDTSGRNIVRQVFTDPVAPSADFRTPGRGTAPGRIATTYLDGLGRTDRTEVQLGSDYSTQTMIVGRRTFDRQGRVLFEADPFPSSQDFTTAYGTTTYFNVDGTPSCSIRSNGVRARAATYVTDEAHEVYPTCFKRTYEFNNSTEVYSIQGADSLLASSGQSGVKQLTAVSAVGRPLVKSVVQTDSNGNITSVLDRMHFGYDHLGRGTLMARFQDPNGVTKAIVTTSHYDSLGQLIELDEPSPNAPQFRSYDTWGELTATGWCDSAFGACGSPATPSSANRSSVAQYDALGRLVHREDKTNSATDPGTVNDYVYDQGVNTITPAVTATNVLGRLAKATAPTSTAAFSYDAFGRVNATTFTDTTDSNKVYVQKGDYHGDGSLQTLHLLLPDNAFKDEKVDYTYDSTGRTRSAKYNDGANLDLFTTTGSNDIDVFGRIRNAKYGLDTYTATYADNGRRLLSDVNVTAPGSLGSRDLAFTPPTGTVTAFDPMGRERVRQETRSDIAGTLTTTPSYDALGRLATATKVNGATTLSNRSYTYDALGNDLTLTDVLGANGATLTYLTTDRDRICSIGYGAGAATPPATCNVLYDGVGNIIQMPRRGGKGRLLSYFPNGKVKQVINATSSDGTDVATYHYDAFGAVQQLVVTSTASLPGMRRDKHFGAMITRRDEGGNSVVTRAIPAPGLTATRHGGTGPWTFAFGEQKGTRFVTDQTGAFKQDVDYQPYGEVIASLSTGAQPGTTNYTSEQWNGQDALTLLGVSQLGARMYDPVIGRFLSRDPLIIPRTSSTTNPYAFAANDPVNKADPSGMDWSFCFIICFGGDENGGAPADSGGSSGSSSSGAPSTGGNRGGASTPGSSTTSTSSSAPSVPVAPSGGSLPRCPTWCIDVDAVNARMAERSSIENPVFPGGYLGGVAGNDLRNAAAYDQMERERKAQVDKIGRYALPLAASVLGGAVIAELAGAIGTTIVGGGELVDAAAVTNAAAEGTLTYGDGYLAGEAAANEGRTLVLGKYPGNVEFVARTPGTVTVDVPGWTPTYNAGMVRGNLDAGGKILTTSQEFTGTFAIEMEQILGSW